MRDAFEAGFMAGWEKRETGLWPYPRMAYNAWLHEKQIGNEVLSAKAKQANSALDKQ